MGWAACQAAAGWQPALLGLADLLAFHAMVGLAGWEILVFVDAAAGPLDDDTIDLGALSYAEGDWQLRLRQITGAAADHARLVACAVKEANHSADSIPVGLGSLKLEANA